MLVRRSPSGLVVANAAVAALVALAALTTTASPALAVNSGPGWQIRTLTSPTNISPVNGGKRTVLVSNVGAKPTDLTGVTITDTLPTGVTPTRAVLTEPTFVRHAPVECAISGQLVTCAYP